jgi:hypothetical protein
MIRLDLTSEEYEALLFILGFKAGQLFKKGSEDREIILKAISLGVQLVGKAQRIGEIPLKNKEKKNG